MTTNDPIDFARWAAELECDATVGAGTLRPSHVKRSGARRSASISQRRTEPEKEPT